MFWKIYFWILCSSLGFGYIGIAFSKGLTTVYILDLIISVPSLLGFFLFAYKKILLNAKFWQAYLITYVLWDCFFNLIYLPRTESGFSWANSFIGFALIFPMWIALYLYGFKYLKERTASK